MNLYQQLDNMMVECRMRRFSPTETMELLGLCVYAFADKLPTRAQTLPYKNQVLSSHRVVELKLPS